MRRVNLGGNDFRDPCCVFNPLFWGVGSRVAGTYKQSRTAGIDAGNGTTLSVGLGNESGFVAAAGLTEEHGVVGQRFEVGTDGCIGV